MKKFISGVLLLLVQQFVLAQVKISEMPTATNDGRGAFFPIVQGGVNKKLSVDSLKNYTDSVARNVTTNILQTLGIDSSTRLITGLVLIDSGFDGHNTDLYYKILGRYYNADYSTFTLPNTYPTQGHWEAVIGDTLGQISIESFPFSPIVYPTVNPVSQILLAAYYIPAFATTPEGISSQWIYRNATYPGEWNLSRGTISTGYDSAYATNPFGGSGVSLRIPSMISGQYFEVQDGAVHNVSKYSSLDFYLRKAGAVAKNTYFGVSFYLGGSPVTTGMVLIKDGQFGYDRTAANEWSPIALRLNDFQFVGQTFDKVRFTNVGATSVSQQFDDMKLQTGGANTGGSPFVESVNGQVGHVQVIAVDSVTESLDTSKIYYWDKRTGTLLDSSYTHLKNSYHDTCFVVTTPDSVNFFIAFDNARCGGLSAVSVVSFEKNVGGDSTILTLSDGTRYAVESGSGSGGITALTGDVTASGTGSVVATLATVNSNVGTYGSATEVPVFTLNAKGLITGVTNTTITGGSGGTTSIQTQTVASNVVTFSSLPATYADYEIFRNGVRNYPVTDYTTSGNVVTGAAWVDGDEIIMQRIK